VDCLDIRHGELLELKGQTIIVDKNPAARPTTNDLAKLALRALG
jgi:hypothetical protein